MVDLTDVCRSGSLHLDLRLDPPHLFTVCAMSMTCSSHDMSCPSPVVPPMMSPCTPLSICRQQDRTLPLEMTAQLLRVKRCPPGQVLRLYNDVGAYC